MAKKELRCDHIKQSNALVLWDDPGLPNGNRQKVWAHGLTEDEVESVLLDDDAVVERNRSYPEHGLVFGYTHTGRFIAVAWEILDDKRPAIKAITAFEPSDD
jgi:uncharacterized DUF497 family protein